MTKITLRSYNREIELITDQGKIDEAIAHCRHILKYFPKHVDTYRLLGKAYLENQRLGDAADILQRVLSAVPDDFVSHIGMSIIREDEGNLDAAIWHMQRAFDVQSANITIQDELRRLYGKRDGMEPPKIRLSRAALARMYAKGDLATQAIAELRAALTEEPDRIDLLVLLARMYHLNGQRVKTVQTASQVLNKLPYCLEANLILSQALTETNRSDEAAPHLEKARELDPYVAFLSPQAPTPELVPDAAVTLLKLDESEIRIQTGSQEQPAWASSLGIEVSPSGDPQDSVEWLLSGEDEDFTSGDPDLAASFAASTAFSLGAAAAEPAAEETTHSDAPPAEDNIPDWMKQAGWNPRDPNTPETPPAPTSETADLRTTDTDAELAPAEIPDWLQSLAPASLTEETAPQRIFPDQPAPAKPAADLDLPDWLSEMEEPAAPTEDTGTPDWLADLPPADQTERPPTPQAATPADTPQPDWLQDLGTDAPPAAQSGEDSGLDWLRSLAESETAPPQDTAPADEFADLFGAPAGTPAAPPAASNEPDWFENVQTGTWERDQIAGTGVTQWLEQMASGEPPAPAEPTEPAADAAPAAQPALDAPAEEPEGLFLDAPTPSLDPISATAPREMPEWLQSLDDEIISAQEPANGMADAQPAETSDEIVPAWLQGLDDELLTAGTAEPTATEELMEDQNQMPELPDMDDTDAALRWLESLAANQGAKEEELLTRPEDRTAEPPAWLQAVTANDTPGDTLGDTAQPPQAASPAEAGLPSLEWDTPEEIPAPAEAGLPEWMTTTSVSDKKPESAAPDWLADEAGEPETPGGDALAWLEGLSVQEQTAPADTAPAWMSAEVPASADETPAEFAAEEEDTEGWLASLMDETPAAADAPAGEDVPAWLKDTLAEPEETAGDADLPSWLRAAETPVSAESTAEPAAPAELPEWLQQTMISGAVLPEDALDMDEEPAAAAPAAEEEAYSWITEPEAIAEAPAALDLSDDLMAMLAEDEPGEEPAPAAAPSSDDLSWLTEADEEETGYDPAAIMDEKPAPAPAPPEMEEEGVFALNTARNAMADGNVDTALQNYQSLIKKKEDLNRVIQDLTEALQYKHPVNVDVWQTLGDAYARNDQIQEALNAYTKAEELLR
jgi:tetratricopeptide (TPR) repeat protein